jgi:hypothetical protein
MTGKALQLKEWFDSNVDDRGVIDFDFDEYYKMGLRNFVDHPGLGMHDADHVGIDRNGASFPLNTFFLLYLEELSVLAGEADLDAEAKAAAEQARSLRVNLRRIFFDGEVVHDSEKRREGDKGERLSEGTSWQANSLAVVAGVVEPEKARSVMTRMIDGYDTLCRCTPYFHFFFLPALHIAGMDEEARSIIVREWGKMIDGGATSTWETFLGNEKDSLCHPWGISPLLYLLGKI